MKTLVKPDIKTVYLNNKTAEKITYLDVDRELGLSSLLYDIKNGAAQFEGVLPFVRAERRARIVVISADTRELGYMAVTYIAACLNEEADAKGEDEEEYLFCPFDTEEKNPFQYDASDYLERPFDDGSTKRNPVSSAWLENRHRIPVIEAGEIKGFVSSGKNTFDFGGYMGSMDHSSRSEKPPYWMSCRKEAVCIVCNESDAEYLAGETLDVFSSNEIVYVIFSKSGRSMEAFFELPFGVSETEALAIRNNLILSYAADEVEVSMQSMYAPAYYEYNLKQNLKGRKIKVTRGFHYRRVIDLANSMNENEPCTMIDKIINYALKGCADQTGIRLKNADFDFIDRFQRTAGEGNKEKACDRLEKELVGIDGIKEQVRETVTIMKFNKLRSSMQISGSRFHNVHVMLGAPGTAKTTVAQLMGQMMMEEGLLPDNRMICINGAELKGQYVGQSAPKTKALFDNYDVIIIDEAYSIVDTAGGTDSYASEAIAQLILELERHSMDKLVVFAGYGGKNVSEKDDKMSLFLNANPGIKSRITSTFVFDSYSAEEMVRIFLNIAQVANYSVDKSAYPMIRSFFDDRVKDESFGNGREARNLLETCVIFTAKRIMQKNRTSYTAEEMKTITEEDVSLALKRLSDNIKNSRTQRKTGRVGFVF